MSRGHDPLLQLIEPRRDIGKFGGGGRRCAFLLQFIEPCRNIGKSGGKVLVEALAELIQTRSVVVLDLIEVSR